MGENVRKLGPGRLIIATHNAGKLKEINDLMCPFGIVAASAGELGLEEPEETGKTFAENAAIKAHAAVRGTNLPSLADDSRALHCGPRRRARDLFSPLGGPGERFRRPQ